MTHLRYSINAYGTTISHHRCNGCGVEFSVCPAAYPEDGWDACLAPTCSTYDPARDVDAMLDADGMMALVPSSHRGKA